MAHSKKYAILDKLFEGFAQENILHHSIVESTRGEFTCLMS